MEKEPSKSLHFYKDVFYLKAKVALQRHKIFSITRLLRIIEKIVNYFDSVFIIFICYFSVL